MYAVRSGGGNGSLTKYDLSEPGLLSLSMSCVYFHLFNRICRFHLLLHEVDLRLEPSVAFEQLLDLLVHHEDRQRQLQVVAEVIDLVV